MLSTSHSIGANSPVRVSPSNSSRAGNHVRRARELQPVPEPIKTSAKCSEPGRCSLTACLDFRAPLRSIDGFSQLLLVRHGITRPQNPSASSNRDSLPFKSGFRLLVQQSS